MEECKSKCKGTMLVIMGLVLIVVTIFKPTWNIWIVIGTMLVIKGGLKLFMSRNCCTVEAPTAKPVSKAKKR